MTTEVTMIVEVQHECVDGYHEFSSRQVPGLYLVAEQNDLEAAFDDIPAVISALIRSDFGGEVAVEPTETYSEYADRLPDEMRSKVHHYSIARKAA